MSREWDPSWLAPIHTFTPTSFAGCVTVAVAVAVAVVVATVAVPVLVAVVAVAVGVEVFVAVGVNVAVEGGVLEKPATTFAVPLACLTLRYKSLPTPS